ncbi:MAG: hypothetical protein WAZ18_00295 [Alphaproteobacteria bacterium]
MIKNNNLHRCMLVGASLALPSLGFALAERLPAIERGVKDGVVIAETRMAQGDSSVIDALGQPADCNGPALQVKVASALGESHALYDASGEPCSDASLLFDGTSALGQRAADPAVQIGFVDALGAFPAETLPALPRIVVNSDLMPADAPLATPTNPVGAPAADPLAETIRAWQGNVAQLDDQTQRDEIIGQGEATQAALRSLDRQTVDVSSQHDKVNTLLASLREKERELAAAEARAKSSRLNSQQQRSMAEATLTKAQQAEQAMRAELQAAKERLALQETQNQQLAASKAKQEKLLTGQIASMGDDLKAAEAKANAGRQELIAQAAAKIAEAEALANTARLQEADAKAREAARLKQEAETMLARAMDLANNKAVIASGMENISPKAAPMALMDVPVVFHATNQTLPELLQAIVKQAEPQAGAWKADFQLTKANSFILSEKWSLTAEAPVKDLLDILTQQIQTAHKVKLTFTQFPQARLVVVTDN